MAVMVVFAAFFLILWTHNLPLSCNCFTLRREINYKFMSNSRAQTLRSSPQKPSLLLTSQQWRRWWCHDDNLNRTPPINCQSSSEADVQSSTTRKAYPTDEQDNQKQLMLLRNAIAEQPNNEPLLFNYALLLQQELSISDYTSTTKDAVVRQAIQAFEQALAVKDRGASWYSIALLKQELGDIEGALYAYNRAIGSSRSSSSRSTSTTATATTATTATTIISATSTSSSEVTAASFNNMIQLLLEHNRLDEAAQAANAFVNAFPELDSSWAAMGIILRENKSDDVAMICFQNALKINEENAVALNNLGNIFWRKGMPGEAKSMYQRAFNADNTDESSAYSLALLLRDEGKIEEALELFSICVDLNPGNVAASFQLAALQNDPAVDRCPVEYVTELFDHYASGYDQHMLNELNYSVPEALWKAFLETCSFDDDATARRELRICELGVGTGLTGARFREGLAGLNFRGNESGSDRSSSSALMEGTESTCYDVVEFSGCDLSSEMVVSAFKLAWTADPDIVVGESDGSRDATAHAADSPADGDEDDDEEGSLSQVYTDLAVADCCEYLQNRLDARSTPVDLILAGDVLCYLGDLQPLFRLSRRMLREEGRFIFSVEARGDGTDGTTEQARDNKDDYVLKDTARFAHSPAYLARLADEVGMRVAYSSEVFAIRTDGGRPVYGQIFVLQA